MNDTHYDLLTYIYVKYKENNLKFMENYCKMIYRSDNITGGILNLFFMSEKEMLDQLNIYPQELDVIKMLDIVNKEIHNHKLLPNDCKFVYGIEGCDYLNGPEDLVKLYELGVRSINPVWNEKNKFGSGTRYSGGLTELGKKLIEKAVDLGIMIDVSHANEETFWDIIELVSKLRLEGKKGFVFASHSNCRDLFDEQVNMLGFNQDEINLAKKEIFYKRNLTDDQLLAIKNLDGMIGIIAHKAMSLVTIDDNDVAKKEKQKLYFEALGEQFKHIKNLFGDVDNITVASDNMEFFIPFDPVYYTNSNHFQYENINYQFRMFLNSIGFTDLEIEKIMSSNFENKIYDKLRKID